jgi:hypothetical protein
MNLHDKIYILTSKHIIKAIMSNECPYDNTKTKFSSCAACNKLRSSITPTNLKSVGVWTSIMSSASLLETNGNALLTPCEDESESTSNYEEYSVQAFPKAQNQRTATTIGKLIKTSYQSNSHRYNKLLY